MATREAEVKDERLCSPMGLDRTKGHVSPGRSGDSDGLAWPLLARLSW